VQRQLTLHTTLLQLQTRLFFFPKFIHSTRQNENRAVSGVDIGVRLWQVHMSRYERQTCRLVCLIRFNIPHTNRHRFFVYKLPTIAGHTSANVRKGVGFLYQDVHSGGQWTLGANSINNTDNAVYHTLAQLYAAAGSTPARVGWSKLGYGVFSVGFVLRSLQ
jgi:hypothetical protein